MPARLASTRKRRLEISVSAEDLANVRQLAKAHSRSVSSYLVECALGRLQPGRDRVAELEQRMDRLEQTQQQAARGY